MAAHGGPRGGVEHLGRSELEPDEQRRKAGRRPAYPAGHVDGDVAARAVFPGRIRRPVAERQSRVERGGSGPARLLERFDAADEGGNAFAVGFGGGGVRFRCGSCGSRRRGPLRRLRFQDRGLVRIGQDQIAHPEARQQGPRLAGQIAAVAQETARGDRQFGNEFDPLLLLEPRGGHRRRGGLRIAFGEVGEEPRVAQPQPRFAQDPRLVGGGKLVGNLG